MSEPTDKFTPSGKPLSLEEIAEYVEDGGVTIKRSDVERAIATSDEELKSYLEATQYKQKK